MAASPRKSLPNAREHFERKKRFLSDVVPFEEHDNFYNPSTMAAYGKTDLDGNIVYLSEENLAALPNPNKTSGMPIYALNFVSEAFRELRRYYLKGIETGIVKNDKTNSLEPIQGWDSVHTLYGSLTSYTYGSLVRNMLVKRKALYGEPTNLDSFIDMIMNLYDEFVPNFNLTRSSFIFSHFCPISITGLVIEVRSDITHSLTDYNRTQGENKNFDFYMKALKKFGFMADYNNPYRIVADIGSPIMQGYMSRYGVTVKNLFEKYYYKANEYDYDLVKIYLTQFYNDYAADFPFKKVVTKPGGIAFNNYTLGSYGFNNSYQKIPVATGQMLCQNMDSHVIKREQVTEQQLQDEYDSTYWLPVYIRVLNYEYNSPLDKHKLDTIIKNAIDINKNVDFESAKGYINKVFKNFRYPIQATSTPEQQARIVDVYEQDAFATAPQATGNGGSTSGGSSGGGGY
tara:strand:+ start:7060 stop:8430 length:1371 start_codon:yes stop_codon:yes gene_type:complete